MLICECPHRDHETFDDGFIEVAQDYQHSHLAAIPTQLAFELRELPGEDHLQVAICAACADERH